ncbi:hypothetical protein EVAR_4855_1 [Eumeta japonica]|uniref:Uncharacterized protein n=1 Tax=Eumeta variegata TaxID=151549 RepID=A0A4C1T2K3_EUMVA|nr:hypothetical protein EVAR_4855_1 [Eumeta japonica]
MKPSCDLQLSRTSGTKSFGTRSKSYAAPELARARGHIRDFSKKETALERTPVNGVSEQIGPIGSFKKRECLPERTNDWPAPSSGVMGDV